MKDPESSRGCGTHPGMNHLLTSALNKSATPCAFWYSFTRHGNGLSRVETERNLLLRRIVNTVSNHHGEDSTLCAVPLNQ